MRQTSPVGRFIIRLVLWLAPLFVLWYVAAPVLLIPVTGGAHFVLSEAFPHAIAAVEPQGTSVDIVTRFSIAAPSQSSAPPGPQGQLVFTINALKYFYGLPLLLALTLAAPATVSVKVNRAAIGAVLLLPVPIWGIAFEALKVLVFNMPPAVSTRMGTSPLTRDLLVLGYQLGYLILPAVTPVLIWAALHRTFLAELFLQVRRVSSAPPRSD
jgi:hypothetical protein